MEILLWGAVFCLLLAVLILSVKIYLMKKSASEIEKEFELRIHTDTNTLIAISSRDSSMQRLADSVNRQLRQFRSERRRFLQGDLELKEAITSISHDLRTPLTAILGYLELLDREEKNENTRRYLAQIANRTEALKQLTEELFRYSVLSSSREMDPKETDLRQVLEESLLSFYGSMKQRNMTPVIVMPEHPVSRFLDPAGVSRIFGNIISNALKYSDGDLQVTLEESGKIIFSNEARGLTPVRVGRLFDRFYTVETGRSSTGLAIAKLLTERMGGTISAEDVDSRLSIIVCFPNKKEGPLNHGTA